MEGRGRAGTMSSRLSESNTGARCWRKERVVVTGRMGREGRMGSIHNLFIEVRGEKSNEKNFYSLSVVMHDNFKKYNITSKRKRK